jgi:hypothetical protein
VNPQALQIQLLEQRVAELERKLLALGLPDMQTVPVHGVWTSGRQPTLGTGAPGYLAQQGMTAPVVRHDLPKPLNPDKGGSSPDESWRRPVHDPNRKP